MRFLPDSTSGFAPVFGALHATVDASTVIAVLGSIIANQADVTTGFWLIVGYDFLAFTTQAPLGLVVDRFGGYRRAAQAGICLAAIALILMPLEPFSTTVLAGTGNALFHVGGGALSLHVRPKRATAPGLFVAPGALGLSLGLWMGRSLVITAWPLWIALAVALLAASFMPVPHVPVKRPKTPPPIEIPRPVLLVALLLFSVLIRSFVGKSSTYACPKSPELALGLALAAFGGKALGGIVADRLGWVATSVGALLSSIPFIVIGAASPVWLTVGLFLFQMTMPVTLVAIAIIIANRPAFAFGLPCLALFIGTILHSMESLFALFGPTLFTALILLSALVILHCLVMLRRAGELFP